MSREKAGSRQWGIGNRNSEKRARTERTENRKTREQKNQRTEKPETEKPEHRKTRAQKNQRTEKPEHRVPCSLCALPRALFRACSKKGAFPKWSD
jgi:hypothetical protein